MKIPTFEVLGVRMHGMNLTDEKLFGQRNIQFERN